jgi:two-component system, NarL family, sensor histidine kinase BarA
MKLDTLATIDWQMSIKLAGNKQEIAKELLELLVLGLPNDLQVIKELYSNQKFNQLSQYFHKMHGAICYCGLPRLKYIIHHLEIVAKTNDIHALSPMLSELEHEIQAILTSFPSLMASI